VVGFNLVVGAGTLAGDLVRGSFAPALAALLILEVLPLWWRRRYPLLVVALVAVAELARWVFGLSNEPAGPALVFAVYAVSVYGRPQARLAVAAIAIGLIVLAVGLLLLGEVRISRNLIPAGALSLVAWVIGDNLRSRRRFFADLIERHRKEREQAAEDERLRIARELHDVVAHNVSVIAIQAGAARVAGASSADALQSIETTARDTLSELNRLLGVLRKQPDAPLAPQPGLEQLDGLVKSARDAGLGATLKVVGNRRDLPAALDLSAYRIIQEAITNVLKHAQASRVEVILDYQPDALVIVVSDNGSGARSTDGTSSGHGLIGMRERVELFKGELTSGGSTLGGFTVRARLPL